MTTSLPGELTRVLQRVRDGSFNASLEHRLGTIANHMAYGILTAALFLGSCRLPDRKIPPVYGEISIFRAQGGGFRESRERLQNDIIFGGCGKPWELWVQGRGTVGMAGMVAGRSRKSR